MACRKAIEQVSSVSRPSATRESLAGGHASFVAHAEGIGASELSGAEACKEFTRHMAGDAPPGTIKGGQEAGWERGSG